MSRPIRFRAWHEGRKVWLNGYKPGDDGCNILGEVIWAFGEWCRVPLEELNDVVVEQFIGLVDAKGMEIYEGDILRAEWDAPVGHLVETSIVRWGTYENDSGHLAHGPYRRFVLDLAQVEGESGASLSPNDKLSVVIGNIHEHQHLLQS